MQALVTGAAGFIGSTLVDRLLADGHDVVGVDCFTDYYTAELKRQNIEHALSHDGFRLFEVDLREAQLTPLLEGSDVVFHQAAQAGVRLSWSERFADYSSHNVLATQRLLEAVRALDRRPRVVYASSSSVYGNAPAYPTAEIDLPRPHSPYGVTKLAAEHLCALYAANWGVDTISLRYFTVYGPRQRPDMALHRLIDATLNGERFPLYGDGSAVRDFTFVDDIVAANVVAATAAVQPGQVFNVAGGGSIAMRDLLDVVGAAVGRPVRVDQRAPQPGDVHRTGGSIDAARAALGWAPLTAIEDGVAAQVAWHRQRPG